MTRHLQVITQSAVRSYRKCPRFYNLYYEKLYRAVSVAEALRFGDVWHQVREVWWGAPASQRLDQALTKLSDVKQHNELDEWLIPKLLVMLRGYHTRWEEYVNSLDVVGVELPFTIPLVNPRSDRTSQLFEVQGKLDAVVRENGVLWVVEEKTAGSDLTPESPYWRRLEIDPQCSVYFDAVHKLFSERPAGIMYFVNVKPQYKPLKKTENIKTKKDGSPRKGQRLEDESPTDYAVRMAEKVAEAPERFFQMVHVPRLEKDVEQSQIDVWDTAKAIRNSQHTGVWLRNPDACIHPFGPTCAFLPVCSNRADIDDQMLYRKAKAQHEELVNPEEVNQ